MEAAIADREAELTEWNDARLDELSNRMDNGFREVNKRIDGVDDDLRHLGERFDALCNRFDALGNRFDAMQRTLMQVGGGIVVGLIGLVATLIGLIATQI